MWAFKILYIYSTRATRDERRKNKFCDGRSDLALAGQARLVLRLAVVRDLSNLKTNFHVIGRSTSYMDAPVVDL